MYACVVVFIYGHNGRGVLQSTGKKRNCVRIIKIASATITVNLKYNNNGKLQNAGRSRRYLGPTCYAYDATSGWYVYMYIHACICS